MTPTRARELAARLSPEDRAALENGHWCAIHEPKPRKERARKPAPPHEYRSCRITTADGSWLVCAKADCQDKRHAVMAQLGVVR